MLAYRLVIIILALLMIVTNAFKLTEKVFNDSKPSQFQDLEIPETEFLTSQPDTAYTHRATFNKPKINYQLGFQSSKILKDAQNELGLLDSLKNIRDAAKTIVKEIENCVAE